MKRDAVCNPCPVTHRPLLWSTSNTQNHCRLEYEECVRKFTPFVGRRCQALANEVRNYALGQTDNGRLLFIAFTVHGTRIRVIYAGPMSGKERQIYGQANS